MNKQKGIAVLFVVSALLLVMLIMVLSSYKSLFFQIKRAHNHIEAKQEKWLAEGGLECAYTISKQNPDNAPNDNDYAHCNISKLTISPQSPSQFLFSSQVNERASVEKVVRYIPRSTGAIQTRSDLKLIGSYTFTPEFVYPDRCVSVRFQSSVYLKGAFVTTNPANHFCGARYLTDTQRSDLCVPEDPHCDSSGGIYDYEVKVVGENSNYIGEGKLFAHDFVHDATLDPFYSFFGYPREEIERVRLGFEVVDGSIESSPSCQDIVRMAFSRNKKVWIQGDCDLKDASELSEGTIGSEPKVLVVENGILSANGSHSFPGMIYHLFTLPIGDMQTRWSNETSVHPYINHLDEAEKRQLTFFSYGSFRPMGGYVFDTEGGLSVFGSAIDLEFDSSVIPSQGNKISWLRGSWNDL